MLNDIKSRFSVSNIIEQRDDLTFFTVDKKHLVALLVHLRDICKFTHLSFLTAVDYLEKGHFQLTYMMHNYDSNMNYGVRVIIERTNPVMESIHHLWEAGETYQRELYEMFGIDFPGSPNITDNFILEGWQNMPPMRRDFDTKTYSEETFFPRPGRSTNDPASYMKEKLYDEGEKWEDEQ